MDDPRVPTPGEAARDAHEEWLIRTYEERFLEWCYFLQMDPDDTGSVLAYEEWWVNVEEE